MIPYLATVLKGTPRGKWWCPLGTFVSLGCHPDPAWVCELFSSTASKKSAIKDLHIKLKVRCEKKIKTQKFREIDFTEKNPNETKIPRGLSFHWDAIRTQLGFASFFLQLLQRSL